MSLRKVMLVLAVAAAPLLLINAQGPAPDLPAAPIMSKVRTACMECHDSGIIVQQRLDKKTWTKEVDKMIKWGALVESADRQAFIDYLSSNFGPDKPPAAPQYKSQAASAEQSSKPTKKQ